MAIEFRYAVNQATGEFVYGAGADTTNPHGYDVEPGLSVGHIRVVTVRAVDQRTERWNGSAIVAKTASQIAAFDRDARFAEAAKHSDDVIEDTLLTALVETMRQIAAGDATDNATMKTRIRARIHELRMGEHS